MDKKIKVSIDIDGTINSSDTSIKFFQMMTHLLLPEAHITILTNREPGTEEKIAQELKQMKIQYDDDLPPENSTSCNWSPGMIELDATGEILCEVNGLKRIG